MLTCLYARNACDFLGCDDIAEDIRMFEMAAVRMHTTQGDSNK